MYLHFIHELQELRDLSSRHEATEASIAASLTELDNQVSSKQTMLMTLEEEIAHRRKALLTDKQKVCFDVNALSFWAAKKYSKPTLCG